MTTLLALIAALSLASIPIAIGWRRTAGEANMAHAMGITLPQRKFDPTKYALQMGTGLTFNQLLFGFLAWVIGGFVAGLSLGMIAAVLFAVAGGLLYSGSLSTRRQEFRLRQSKDILRGLGVMETLLKQGKPLNDALEEAANAVGPDGGMVERPGYSAAGCTGGQGRGCCPRMDSFMGQSSSGYRWHRLALIV